VTKEREKKNIPIIFWNVAGLTSLEEEDWEQLRKYDLISISETWIEKENKIIECKMKNHESLQIKARREKRKEDQKEAWQWHIKKI